MTTITPELKTFMEDLWGAEGDFIDTPLGRGRIENVRTKAGIDLEVMVNPKPKLPPIKSLKTGEWRWLDDVNFSWIPCRF